jgi:hypothetical protein
MYKDDELIFQNTKDNALAFARATLLVIINNIYKYIMQTLSALTMTLSHLRGATMLVF